MPPADQTASAKNTPLQKPAARYPPRPRAFAHYLLPRQIGGSDDARHVPQMPPCILAPLGQPVRDRESRRRPSSYAPARLSPPGVYRRAPLLGRAPYAFGYGRSLRVAPTCIKCFTFHSASLYLLPILPTWNNTRMIIGDRLRALREEKKLSQGDIEKRTGLLRCYISRVENGHTVPAIETLEKLARALECPLYQLFYDGEEPPQLPNLPKRKSSDDIAWGSVGKDARFLNKLRRLLSKVEEGDRKLILYMAQKMANR